MLNAYICMETKKCHVLSMLLTNTEHAEQLIQNELRMTVLLIQHKKLKSRIAPLKMPPRTPDWEILL